MKITVDSAETDRDHWKIVYTVVGDDGTTTRLLYALPQDTMEWRAAEYGIEPTDTATLLDIVLVEPHLTPQDWAAGHQLHTAPDIDTARKDHVARCAAAKLRCRLSTRTKGSPLARVQAESPMDLEVIAVKREHVDLARRDIAQQQHRALAVAPKSGANRAAELRARLLPPAPLVTTSRPEEDL